MVFAVFAIFVALDDVAAIQDLIIERANELLLDPMEISAMELVEGDAGAAGAGEETHRH
jgi:hypothetical protein